MSGIPIYAEDTREHACSTSGFLKKFMELMPLIKALSQNVERRKSHEGQGSRVFKVQRGPSGWGVLTNILGHSSFMRPSGWHAVDLEVFRCSEEHAKGSIRHGGTCLLPYTKEPQIGGKKHVRGIQTCSFAHITAIDNKRCSSASL